jgi:peptide-methionine (S)-S-oxide reductase
VVRTRVGYAGGTSSDPTYQRLGDHSEAVEIDYDPEVLRYEDLLGVFWTAHDPSGPPRSVQYRSAILYRAEEERAAAEASKARIESAIGPVSTSIEPLRHFYRAEDYHQKYRLRARRDLISGFLARFDTDREFVDSTLAARVNGWLDGHGPPAEIAAAGEKGAHDAVSGRAPRRGVAPYPGS